MRCADNSSFEFVFYSKLQFSGVSDDSADAGPCRSHAAQGDVGNATAALCRDGAPNASAAGGGGLIQPPYTCIRWDCSHMSPARELQFSLVL